MVPARINHRWLRWRLLSIFVRDSCICCMGGGDLFDIFRTSSTYIAILAGLAGLVYFLYRALAFAESLPTIVWDESMYLYKGYLFATGRYQPFEDFGPWTNQLPVSFLIPGYIQKWFGPGMRTGRMYRSSANRLPRPWSVCCLPGCCTSDWGETGATGNWPWRLSSPVWQGWHV